jgi:hypothetical protein
MARAYQLFRVHMMCAWYALCSVASSDRASKSVLPHNRTHWTEGFLCFNGMLYESTGMWGHSQISAVPLTNEGLSSPPSLHSDVLAEQHFGEGIAVNPATQTLYQLTYNSALIFSYDATKLGAPTSSFPLHKPQAASGREGMADSFLRSLLHESLDNTVQNREQAGATADQPPTLLATEAWGLAFNPVDKHFVASDGTTNLYRFSDDFSHALDAIPVTFSSPEHATCPTLASTSWRVRLNELEFIPATKDHACPIAPPETECKDPHLELWAAVAGCSSILRINACTSTAVGWITPAHIRASRTSDRKTTHSAPNSNPMHLAPAPRFPDSDISSFTGVLMQHQHDTKGDLNGIAYCATEGGPTDVLITGKYWEHTFRISLPDITASCSCFSGCPHR